MIYNNATDYEKDRAEALRLLEIQKVNFNILDKIIPNDGSPKRITNLFFNLLKQSKFQNDNSTNTEPETANTYPKFHNANDFFIYVKEIAKQSTIPCIFSVIDFSNNSPKTMNYLHYNQNMEIIDMLASTIKNFCESNKIDLPTLFKTIIIANLVQDCEKEGA